MAAQKTLSSQSDLKQKEERAMLENQNIWSQTRLQSHSNKNSIVLAQKQTQKPIETEYPEINQCT